MANIGWSLQPHACCPRLVDGQEMCCATMNNGQSNCEISQDTKTTMDNGQPAYGNSQDTKTTMDNGQPAYGNSQDTKTDSNVTTTSGFQAKEPLPKAGFGGSDTAPSSISQPLIFTDQTINTIQLINDIQKPASVFVPTYKRPPRLNIIPDIQS